jgi:hypothetical protein
VREQSSQRFGLQPISPPSAQFAPMGDDEGLLIVVAADRRWFPSRRTCPTRRACCCRSATWRPRCCGGRFARLAGTGSLNYQLPDAPPPPLRPPPPDQLLELLEDELDDGCWTRCGGRRMICGCRVPCQPAAW